MVTIRRAEERGHANHGWLNTWHTFSFADYYDPRFSGFGSLRVINDDTVAPGAGFGTHPHRDMEILSYVLSGALQHRDSMGSTAVMRAGDVQRISAGTGIQHSEFNASPTEPVHFLQIWILPDRKNVKPDYAEKSFAGLAPGRFQLVASAGGRDGSLPIHQDADVFLARFRAGDEVTYPLRTDRQAWLHVAEGEIALDSQWLMAGDGAAIQTEGALKLSGRQPGQVLLFDLN